MSDLVKFCLRRRSGEPFRWLIAEKVTLKPPKLTKKMKHHIVVLDRSGSMWGDMQAMRGVLEQVLVVQGVRDPKLMTSLISYSSQGDMTVHWSRVPASEVLDPTKGYTQIIRGIQATAMTCISQALKAALGLVQAGETTCISLHSDGYANDGSPASEKRAIEALLEESKKKGGVCIDTVAWRESSDFVFLQKVATAMSGRCVLAKDARQVEKMLRETTAKLAGEMVPQVVVERDRETDWIALYSRSADRVNGSAEDLVVDGLSPKDDVQVWRYAQVSETAWSASTADEVKTAAGGRMLPVYLYASSRLRAGDLFLGKGAVVESKNLLLRPLLRAITPTDLHALFSAIDQALLDPGAVLPIADDYRVTSDRASVLEVIEALDGVRGKVEVVLDDPTFRQGYQRRSLVRLPGQWGNEADGNVLNLPKTRLMAVRATADLLGFEANQSEATIQMKTVVPAQLVSWDLMNEIDDVAGVRLDGLKQFRSWTIVADGDVHLKSVPLKIHSRAAFEALRPHLQVSAETKYDVGQTWLLPLAGRSLVPDEDRVTIPSREQVLDLYKIKTVLKVLSALLGKGAPSADLTDDQIQSLAEVHLTPKLYYSAPTSTPWPANQNATAMARGWIDAQVRYRVTFGLPDLRHFEALRSGNEMLQRHGSVLLDGVAQDKPTWPMLWRPGAETRTKAPGPRMKIGLSDKIALDYIQGLLTTWNAESLCADIDPSTRFFVEGWDKMPEPLRVERVEGHKKNLERLERAWMREFLTPALLYIGSTGLLPGEAEAERMLTAEQVEQKLQIKLSPSEKEGSFHITPDGVLVGVYAQTDFYTTKAGRKEIASRVHQAEDLLEE